MKYSETKAGRVFIVRLEDGDVLHEALESFAVKVGITHASLTLIGAADEGSAIISGPKEGRATRIEPQRLELDAVYELTGTGTIIPDESGKPVLHAHASFGRAGSVHTGCVRAGVKVWHVVEAVVTELVGSSAIRAKEEASGFELLQP